MNKNLFKTLFIGGVFLATTAVGNFVQAQTNVLYASAKSYMQQGNYDSAALIYNRLLLQEPDNEAAQKDYAFNLYLKRDYSKCIEISKQLIDKPTADVQSFQILGLAYKAIAEDKECRKMYKQALEKFPNSGVLHNEMGELLASANELPNAITEWELGIKLDANYSSNYYNAAMYYVQTNNYLWATLYGEIFVNLESYSQRTASVKSVLLDVFRKLYATPQSSLGKKLTEFEKVVYSLLNKNIALEKNGITADNLTAIRTRFVLDYYYTKTNEKFPWRMFEQQQFLLKQGLFDAYNQWLFGAAASPSAYQNWIETHDKEAAAFKAFQQSRVFKLTNGQYYK